MSTPIIAARFSGTCALCDARWTPGTPIAPFGARSDHSGQWGHPACVAADEMGAPSVDALRDRIGQIRRELDAGQAVRDEERSAGGASA